MAKSRSQSKVIEKEKSRSKKAPQPSKSARAKGSRKETSEVKKTQNTKKEHMGGVKRPHRFKPGTVALREIRRFQKSTELLIPKAPFQRLVKEIVNEIEPDTRMSLQGLEMLRCDAENFLVAMYEKAQVQAIHAKRVTVMSKDIRLVRYLDEC
jgi:histone H3